MVLFRISLLVVKTRQTGSGGVHTACGYRKKHIRAAPDPTLLKPVPGLSDVEVRPLQLKQRIHTNIYDQLL